jgi:hypothetical protein
MLEFSQTVLGILFLYLQHYFLWDTAAVNTGYAFIMKVSVGISGP